eukprot:jgi/Galph1/4382/GphlegSOOS_G3096.1
MFCHRNGETCCFLYFQTSLQLVHKHNSHKRLSYLSARDSGVFTFGRRISLPKLVYYPKSQFACCQSSQDGPLVRFRIKEDEKMAFSIQEEKKVQSINDKLKKEIEETKRKLGIQERQLENAEVSQNLSVEDLSLTSCFVASTLASLLALVLIGFAHNVFSYYESHPVVNSDVYVVQRLSAVMRTVLIGFSTLAAGLVSVTALGLILLSLQVTFNKLRKMFLS